MILYAKLSSIMLFLLYLNKLFSLSNKRCFIGVIRVHLEGRICDASCTVNIAAVRRVGHILLMMSMMVVRGLHALHHHILFEVRNVKSVKIAYISDNEFNKADHFFRFWFKKHYFFKLLRMLKLDFLSIFFFNKYNNFDSSVFLIFECKNPSKSIPYKFTKYFISIITFF